MVASEMAKSYHGSLILLSDDENGRKLKKGERVQVNGTSEIGTVMSLQEGSHVFFYFVWLDWEDGLSSYKPDQITPLENP